MSSDEKFDVYSEEKAIEYGKLQAGDRWNNEVATVLLVALRDKRNLPRLGFKEKTIIHFQSYIEKWVIRYFKGFDGRPSVKEGNFSRTAPELIFGPILKKKLPNLQDNTINQVVIGHSLLMTIEGFVGLVLEEYLAVRIFDDGWFCCWGSTIDAVDFCKADGSLLQVKTSSNSENSSSVRVRNGTSIEVWKRRNATREGAYYWDELNIKLGRKDLSEEDFQKFTTDIIDNNPGCIKIPDGHFLKRTE